MEKVLRDCLGGSETLAGFHKRPLFSSAPSDSINEPVQSPTSTSFPIAKMSECRSHGGINCNNTNSFNNVWNNYTVADDRSQIMTWLSPLEPRLRHKDIQESRVKSVGRWILQAEEFKSWRAGSGGTESENTVLFCNGDPGVGKTFIR